MGRSKLADRNVTTIDGAVVAARLTPKEENILAALVEREQREMDKSAFTIRATASGVIRRLLREESARIGLSGGSTESASPTQDVPAESKVLKARATFHLPVDLVGQVREYVIQRCGPPRFLSLTAFAEQALRHELVNDARRENVRLAK